MHSQLLPNRESWSPIRVAVDVRFHLSMKIANPSVASCETFFVLSSVSALIRVVQQASTNNWERLAIRPFVENRVVLINFGVRVMRALERVL